MSYGYGHQPYSTQGAYPPDNLYAPASQPYAYPPSPAADDHSQPHFPPYSSQDYISPERDGAGVPGGRSAGSYPPEREDAESLKYAAMGGEGGYGYVEKAGVPVTRGSIAAQMAAEGQIPKKEGLRMWRKDEHAGAMTRGGRARCCGRVFCCFLILAVLILVGIVAAFFLWVKPPDVSFDGIEDPETGNIVSIASGGFNLNFRLKINVINPNFFGADFDRISATAYYPTKPNSQFGGGAMNNVDIKKNSNTTLHFPFSVNYTTSYDSDLSVLKDIATKCGFLGSTKSQLTVNYKVKTKVKVIAVTIEPSFSSSAKFDCPLSESDITGFLGSDGLSSLGLGSLTSSKRSLPAAPDEAAVEAATSHALSVLAQRGLAVLLSPSGAVEFEKREQQGDDELGEEGVKVTVGDKVFDPSRKYRIGTVGPVPW
ncbi:hypothetical protein JCM6882_000259 [Rhodosporidiobolus microsporus]